jgi:hypothetical protein
MNYPFFPQLSRELGFRRHWKRGRPRHAQKFAARGSERRSRPGEMVEPEAIAGPSAAMRWLRRFGERGCGAQDSLFVPCFWSRTPTDQLSSRQAHLFC